MQTTSQLCNMVTYTDLTFGDSFYITSLYYGNIVTISRLDYNDCITIRSSITGDVIIGTLHLGDVSTIRLVKDGDIITMRSHFYGIFNTITSSNRESYFSKTSPLIGNRGPMERKDNIVGIKGNLGLPGRTDWDGTKGIKGNLGLPGRT